MISQPPRRTNALSWVLPCILALAAAEVAVAAPVTTSLPAVADTTLRQQQANQNRGADEQVRLGWAQTSRALVRFDPAAIADAVGAGTLLSAHLELDVEETGESWPGGSQDVGVHRVTEAWTETGATWNCAIDTRPGDNRADCNSRWNGGSFLAAATATVPHTKETRGPVRLDVTADVAAFLAGAANHGWLLKKENEALSGRIDYVSREGVAVERAPRLVLVVEADVADTTPPTVTIISPARDALLSTGTPTISAGFSDEGSGVDVASVRLLIDGVDRTAEAQVTATGLTWSSVLVDGFHVAQVSLRDQAGGQAQATWSFTVDATPPALSLVAPGASVTSFVPGFEVELAASDATSGLDWPASSVRIDAVEIAPGCSLESGSAVCTTPPLASGPHRVEVTVRDYAGNAATAGRNVELVLDQEPPVITLEGPADGAYVSTPLLTVSGTVADAGGIGSLVMNGQALVVVDGRFEGELTLVEGTNSFLITSTDLFGSTSAAEARVVLDTRTPSLTVTSPVAGQITNQPTIRVVGVSEDENGLAALVVNGTPLPTAGGPFEADVPLAEGENLLIVHAEDRAGNEREVRLEVSRYSLPAVTIDTPADLSFLAATATEVRGTVSDLGAAVTVNGVPAQVSAGTFVALDVPLIEGGNILTAVATSVGGRKGTASIHMVRDLFPPRLAVDVPRDGATVLAPSVTVSGMVNDIVAGTVDASDAVVTVNGRQATVAHRSFLLHDLPLVPGTNVLSLEAVDASGNIGHLTLTVVRAEPNVARIAVVSGDRQAGVVGQPLLQPLVVELRDAAGQPVAGRPVVFKVRGGDGRLAGGRRQIAVATDAAGRAATPFTLGLRAGAGNQRVEASAAGFHGPAVLTFDALPGEPRWLLVDAGSQQEGIAGQTLPRPLVAVVTDAGFNRLEGTSVRWSVVKGQGHFLPDGQELMTVSDSDGRAIVAFAVAADEGIANNTVEARIDGMEAGPVATFFASAQAAGADPAATISGVVLDNTNQPIRGATLRILDAPQTAQTDAQGQFRIAGVPVGTLRLIVDGSTVDRPGSWPDLEFVVTTVPGRDNPLTMPVFLLPLDLANGVPVDEVRGGVVTLPEVPGFALEIAPGSVTFPGGSRSGVVSATVVHSDKVPMVPNFGQQPRLIFTIQPAGARFDPPARLTLPNVEGLAPGEVTELYSFDHDLGHFVSIGPGTVSEDGALIVSNPGVGIIKAGWHCGGNPSAAGTSADCPPCQICNGSQCVPGCALPAGLASPPAGAPALVTAAASSCDCSDQDPCLIGNQCTGGCRPRSLGTVKAVADGREEGAVKGRNKPFVFGPEDLFLLDCGSPRYEWKFDDGTMSSNGVVSHAFANPGEHTATLKVRCGACDRVLAQDEVRVKVVSIEIQVKEGATQKDVTGTENWAAVRGAGSVQLEALLTPEDPQIANLIKWSGATADPANPKLATVSKQSPVRHRVQAIVEGEVSNELNVWILWVELELRTSGTMSPTNSVVPAPGDGLPLLGALADETHFNQGFTKAEAAGNIEIVGHLQPAGVHAVVKGGWELRRTVSLFICSNGAVVDSDAGVDDTSYDRWKDLAPESDDRIYDIDGPTAGDRFTVIHTREVYDMFRQWAEWNGEKASSDEYWYYQARIDDDLDAANKPRNNDTVRNDLGAGALIPPSRCAFQPRN